MSNQDPYELETVARACSVLRIFKSGDESLRLKDVVERTGLNHTIVFRLVHTLCKGGLLRQTANHRYQSNVHFASEHRFHLGYAAQDDSRPFSLAVTEGLERATRRADVRLTALDNSHSAKTAISNAAELISCGVDLAIEFQVYERVAPAISLMFQQAGIPLIAVEIPIPARRSTASTITALDCSPAPHWATGRVCTGKARSMKYC